MNTSRILAAGATATALVLSGGVPAMAASPSPGAPSAGRTCSADQLAYVKARVDMHVAQRQVTIRRLTSTLADRPHVSAAHRSTLSGLYTADAAGLAAVDAKVQADTTCKTAVDDGHTVVTDFRVYMLLVPQTHLVTASDTGAWGASRLAATAPKLQTAIDAMTDATKKAAAQAALQDLAAKTAAAGGDYSGVGDVVLGLVPVGMPAGQSTLTAQRARVQAGGTAMTAALTDARTIAGLLA